MEFEELFRYPFIRPAAEAAGSGCEARLRGLDGAIPDYLLKNHHVHAAPSASNAMVLSMHDCTRDT